MDDSELRRKLDKNMKSVFLDWMPEKLKYPKQGSMGVAFSTNRYLSLETTYTFSGRRVDHVYIYNTFDMLTGDVVYADDLLEVDEELVSLILTEGTIKIDIDMMTGKLDANYPKKSLDTEDPAQVLKQLHLCSEPFSEDNWSHKPTFYLEKNRIRFQNVFNYDSNFYIELDKIEHKLKVDKW